MLNKFNKIKLPSNRNFGFFFSFIFGVISFYYLIKGSANLSVVTFILALLFILISIIKPNVLLPLNKLWMIFGYLLGIIIKPIILGVIYFGIFTPLGLIMKLFKRDELKIKNSYKSNWKSVVNEPLGSGSFKNQF